MNEQWAAYQDSKAFADRVATLYGAGEDVLALQKARYGKLVERFEARFGAQKGGLCFFSAPIFFLFFYFSIFQRNPTMFSH